MGVDIFSIDSRTYRKENDQQNLGNLKYVVNNFDNFTRKLHLDIPTIIFKGGVGFQKLLRYNDIRNSHFM